MPIMNEHAYHEDFKKARSNYDRQTSSPTAITKIPPDSTESQSTSIPPDQIQFRDPIENYPDRAEKSFLNKKRSSDKY